MAKLYDKLLVPEAYTALRPYNFVVGVLKSIRTTTAKVADFMGLSLRTLPTKPGYRYITIKQKSVKAVGTTPEEYRVELPVPDIDIIGAQLSEPAIRGRDFTSDGCTYTFLGNPPSFFGTSAVENNEPVVELLCFGGSYSNFLSPLGVPYQGCTDVTTEQAVDDCLYKNAPSGITARLIEALAGAKLSVKPIQQTWVEGNYNIGLTTDGRLVYAPVNSGIIFNVGAPPDTSDVTDNLDDFFYAKLSSGPTIILMGDNNIADHPQITTDVPGIVVSDNIFQGTDVLNYLKNNGYIFYRWNTLKDNGQYTTLGQYQVNPGKVALYVGGAGDETAEVTYPEDTSSIVVPTWTLTSHTVAFNYI